MADGDLAPVDPDLDLKLLCMGAAEALGVSALDVRYRVPLGWISAARIRDEFRAELAAQRAKG